MTSPRMRSATLRSPGHRPVSPRSPRRLLGTGALAVVIVLLAACNPVLGDDAGPVRRYVMSRYSDSSYTYLGDMDRLDVLVPAPFTDGNVREFFWDPATPYVADQQTCMTWETTAAGGEETIQQGIAMRIARRADGTGLRAITLNENIWSGAVWMVFVNLWDSTGEDTRDGTDHTFTAADVFDISPVVGKLWTYNGVLHSSLVAPPWHVCGRLQGDVVRLKVWTGSNPEPTWDDPVHVFGATLPDGWDHPGYSGGYIGHLRENRTATFSGFSTIPLCLAPDMIDTPACTPPTSTTSPSTTSEPSS